MPSTTDKQPNYEANAFLWGMKKSRLNFPGLVSRFDAIFGLQPDNIVREHLSDERIAEIEDSALAFIELVARTDTIDAGRVTEDLMLDVVLDGVYHLALFYADRKASEWLGLKQTPLDALAFVQVVSSKLHGVKMSTPATTHMSSREVNEAVGTLFMRAAKGFPVAMVFEGDSD